MIGRGERLLVPEAPASRSDAQRPLGREVDRLGLEFLEQLADAADAGKRETDLGIGRAWQRIEKVRRDDEYGVAVRLQHVAHRLQGSNDAVDLGLPGVG